MEMRNNTPESVVEIIAYSYLYRYQGSMSPTGIEKHITKAMLFLFFAYVLSHRTILVLLICICVVLAL